MTDPTIRVPLPGEPAPPTPLSPAATPEVRQPAAAVPGTPPATAPQTPPPPPPPAAVPPPAWRPPSRSHEGRTATLIVGVVILAIGSWFFAETTMGLDLPRISWSQLWPLLVMFVGLWIIMGSRRGRST